MVRALRTLGKLARQALQEPASEAWALQKRNMSDINPKPFSKDPGTDRYAGWVKKNPYIEAWYWRRDMYEREFTWDFRTTVEAFYYIGGISAGFYALSLFCMRHSDRRSGYPQRSVLLAETPEKFVLPDELEFY